MHTFIKIFVATLLCSAAISCNARDRQATSDPLDWLGPLPAKLNEKMLHQGILALNEKISRDLRAPDIALDHFVCKRPADVGPTPQMEAVRAYLDAWPDSAGEPELVQGIHRAAAAGNWLARVQLYLLLNPKSLKEQYRHLQLAQWMQRQKIGALYAQIGDDLAASGYYSDDPHASINGIDIYAALHGSYPAQNKVGKALVNAPDTEAIGRAMLACASGSLPEYARIFSGDAEKAAKQRYQTAREARQPPLHRAVISGDAAQVSLQLLAAPTSIAVQNEDDQSALDTALLAKPPRPQIVALLIASGAQASENHRVVPRSETTQLGLAVAAPAPDNLELVTLLMRAGADPFTTNEVHEYVFQTPFADAAHRYDNGKDEEIFAFMLDSRRLAAPSALATGYVDYFGHSPRVLDRLLAYGAVPSGEIFSTSVQVNDAALPAWLDRMRALLGRHAHLRTAMRAEDGANALAQAAYHCRFDLAIALADLGAPFKDDLVGHVVERCDDNDLQAAGTVGQPRRKFFELLVASGNDLDGGKNLDAGSGLRCVAWLPNCSLPDEAIVRELLALGADPYRFGWEKETNGVLAAIAGCKPELAELMLAMPPKARNAALQASLDRSAERAADPYFCSEKPDMRAVLARLISYGAAQPNPPPPAKTEKPPASRAKKT